MTTVADVRKDPNYTPIHNLGFVGLVNHMGSDDLIERAARVSYGSQTRAVSDTRSLLRYLWRHQHTSPFEMGELVFHIKLPIFVMRQLVRHRTASLNEYSARYSVLTDEVYIPEPEYIRGQSKTNKQGSSEQLAPEVVDKFQRYAHTVEELARGSYHELLDSGVSRETARQIIPVNQYTECYWKMDLKNLLHLLRLRMDPHSQQEIVDYANVMFEYTKKLFPITVEAFEDYTLNSRIISKMEIHVLRKLLGNIPSNDIKCMCEYLGELSPREVSEIVSFWTPTDATGNPKY